VIRCPACRCDDTDDDGDRGMWGGTRGEMERERRVLLRDRPRYDDEWCDALAARTE
jgi:hypothetical protein